MEAPSERSLPLCHRNSRISADPYPLTDAVIVQRAVNRALPLYVRSGPYARVRNVAY